MSVGTRTEATTLADLLSAAVVAHREQPALIERDGERVRALTFAELGDAVAGLAGELRSRGVGRSDVVGVWLPNWIEAVVWEFALAAVGAAALGINTRYGVHELTHLLDRGRPVGVVVPARFLDLDFAGRLRSAASAAGGGSAPWVAIVRGNGAQAQRFDVGGGTWRPAALDEPGDGDGGGSARLENAGRRADPVNYFTTSGSTGLPKLAGHDQASVAVHCSAVAAALGMRAGDRFLAALPLSGVFGFNPAIAMLSAGGACLLEPVFNPEVVLGDMEAHGVTHAVGGDDMFGRLMDAWHCADEGERPTLSRFRRGGIADFAGRSREIVEWAEREFGARVSGVYGSSELFSLTSVWPEELDVEARARGGGIVVSEELEVRAVDPQRGEACAPEAVGELQFRGYNVVCGYLGDPEAAQQAFTADGWFRSGDLGFVLAERGSFVYVCRAGDALRLRGFLVEPAEIERFLASHPDVATAKVVGVPSSEGSDLAVAYVQLTAGGQASSDSLVAFCRERLAPFKVPAHINVIDEFPVTTGTNGTKIRTAELRRWAEQQVAEEAQR
jgi:fatty-acyl-CoA synthase